MNNFHGIKSKGAFTITLMLDPSKPESVILTSDEEKSLDKIETFVSSGILHIQPLNTASASSKITSTSYYQCISISSSVSSSSKQNDNGKVDILINAHTLTSLNMSGIGSVEIVGAELTTDTLHITCHGISSIRGKLNVKQLNATIRGISTIKLFGTANALILDIAGQGSFNCFDLKTKTASVSIHGQGQAEISCDEILAVDEKDDDDDNSTIKYKGKATVVWSSGATGAAGGRVQKIH